MRELSIALYKRPYKSIIEHSFNSIRGFIMKNINGYGTVVKLTGKRRKPYASRITTGGQQEYDLDGTPVGKPKQKYKYLNYYEDRKDALFDLAKYNKTNETQSYVKEDKKKYVAPTFLDMWYITEKNKSNLWSKTTYRNYKSLAEKYAKPIHNISLSDLDYATLQSLMNGFMALGKTKGMCKLFKVTLTMVLSEAVRSGFIDHNPASQVRYKGTTEDVKKRVYSTDYIKQLYNSKDFKDQLLLVLVYTGMRINELLKLKMSNVNLEERYLVSGSKTAAGKERIIPIHKCLIPIFRDRLQYEFFMGDKAYSYTTVYSWYKDRDFSFHEARHTFISMCDEYELNETSVKRIVGHSTTNITDRIYTHKTAKQLIEQIDRLPMPDRL